MFSKAQLKRFNEVTDCAPPVGAYDPKDRNKAAGCALDKSERFKHPKDVTGGCSSQDSSMLPIDSSTPIKGRDRSVSNASSESLVQNTSSKGSMKPPTTAKDQEKDKLEKKVNQLLRETLDKDKSLLHLKQVNERLEGRLNSANSEWSSSLARAAQLEKEAKNAQRGLEILQKKIKNIESTFKTKEEQMKAEMKSLQQKTHNKEQGIHTTQNQIQQALKVLLSKGEKCLKDCKDLKELFLRLQIPMDQIKNENPDLCIQSGNKETDVQIKKVHNIMQSISKYLNILATDGVRQFDEIQKLEHQKKKQYLEKILQERENEQECIANSLKQCQADSEMMESKHKALECRMREEYEQMEQQLKQNWQQDKEKHEHIHEQLVQKNTELSQEKTELMKTYLQQQVKHEEDSERLRNELLLMDEKLVHIEKDLQRVGLLQEDTSAQLSSAQECNRGLQVELRESQENCNNLRQQNHELNLEAETLKQMMSSLEHEREICAGQELALKEMEVKYSLVSEAMHSEKDESMTALDNYKRLLLESKAENAALAEQVKELEGENGKLDFDIESLTTKYQANRQELENAMVAVKHCEQLKEDLHEAQYHIVEHQQQAEGFMEAIEILQAKIDEKIVINDEMQKREMMLEVSLREQHKKGDAYEDKLSQLTEKHSKEMEDLNEKCQCLLQEKEQMTKKHNDDLRKVRITYQQDKKDRDLQMGQQEITLQRTQNMNALLKKELDILVKENEKMKDDNRTNMATLQVKLQTAENNVAQASSQVDELQKKLEQSQAELTSLVKEKEKIKDDSITNMATLQVKLQTAEENVAQASSQVDELQKKLEQSQAELTRISSQETEMEKQKELLVNDAMEERKVFEQMISEMSDKIQQFEAEKEESGNEWKEKYEKLFERVEPFMEQINAFAAERDHLLGQSQMAEAEFVKLMDQYATLLGHQNHRQKVRYIQNLKTNYMQSLAENKKLSREIIKQQNIIQNLEKKNQALERKNNPSCLGEPVRTGLKKNVPFQHQPDDTCMSPLKQNNRKDDK